MLSDGSDGKPTEQIHLLFISVAKGHLEKLAFGTYTYKINSLYCLCSFVEGGVAEKVFHFVQINMNTST